MCMCMCMCVCVCVCEGESLVHIGVFIYVCDYEHTVVCGLMQHFGVNTIHPYIRKHYSLITCVLHFKLLPIQILSINACEGE